MNSSPYLNRQTIEKILLSAGVFRFGIAKAEKVDCDSVSRYEEWISQGQNAEMAWMERYSEVRSDPRLLLEDANSLIVCAFPYASPPNQKPGTLRFASYALGDDYHSVIRKRLEEAARRIKEEFGGSTRVCVDTAPLRERYWAWRSGVGFIARNGLLAIPGAGTRFFLGTILTSASFSADSPCRENCGDCRLCIDACPGEALSGGKLPSLDARKCRSYLTIEHRGALPENLRLGNNIYGCDICQNVCPFNTVTPQPLHEFTPRKKILQLTPDDISTMTEEEYRRLFRNSAIRRAPLSILKRNLLSTATNSHIR